MGTKATVLSALSTLFLASVLSFEIVVAQQDPAVVMDPASKEYARWLITGKGPQPPAPASAVLEAPVISDDPVEIGDLMTEVDYYKRFYPGTDRWPLEQRLRAHEQAEQMREELVTKEHSLSSPPSQWTMRGPFGMEHRCVDNMYWSGRVTCIDYSSSRGIYLGTVGGGLWAPLIFLLVPITDKLPTQTAGAVAINPSNTNVIFYGTGDYGTQLGGNGTGTYRSTDAGSHWTLMGISPTPSKTSRVLIAPWNNNMVFVAGNQGIFKSTDNGDTWTRKASWNASDLSSTPSGSVMLAGRGGNGVYKSTDQGDSWTKLTSGFPSDYVGYVRVEICKSNPSRAYVVIARPSINGDIYGTGQVRGVYRTDNLSSATVDWWDMTPSSIGLYPYMYGQGWYHNAIAADPTNSNRIFIGGGALLRSTNAGVDWTNVTTHPHADIKVIFFRPGDNLLYTGGDGGVFTSSDLGATWSPILNQLLPTTLFYNIDVARSNADVVFGASQDNSTEGTSPAARSTWRVSNIADGIDASIDWTDASTVFTTTQYGDVFKSTTGGSECPNWPWLNNGLNKTEWSAYVVQHPLDANWVYYNGNQSIYYSSNKGTNWQGVVNSTPLSGAVQYIAVNSNGNYIYAITNNNAQRLVRYRWIGSPGSPLWEYLNISSGTPAVQPPRIIPSLSSAGRAYVIFNNTTTTERIYRTTDYGVHWSNITGNYTSDIPLHDLVENPNNSNMLWIGTDLGVYKSTNGGTTWWWWNKGMPDAVVVNDLEYAYAPDGDYLVAGTFGRSTYERDINAPIILTFAFANLKGPYSFATHVDNIIAVLDSGKIAKTTNRGSSWTTIATPSNGKHFGAHMFDSLKWIVVGQSGNIYRTTDGGQQWTRPSSPAQSDLRRLAWPTPSHGFAVGDMGVVLESSDGGVSWNDASPGIGSSFFDVFFIDPLNGFIVGTEAGPALLRLMLRTTDGGQTWNRHQGVVGIGSFFDIFFVDPMHGFCTADDGSLLRTSDGGGTWNSLRTPSSQPLYGCRFTTPLNGWVGGAGGMLLRTSDGGQSWQEEDRGSQDTILAIDAAGTALLVGGAGGIMTRDVEQPTTVQYEFSSRWNMVSVPVTLSIYEKTAVFPTAVSSAFSYDGQYVQQTTLEHGPGYWIKFASNNTVNMEGYPRTREVINVSAGWNMIGSIANSVPVEEIIQQPDGIVESRYFGYANGYEPAENIDPAKAYWVKVSENGQLVLDANGAHLSDSVGGTPGMIAQHDRHILQGSNELSITDNSGARQILYFSTREEEPWILHRHELPPSPPSGVFDARFSTGRLIECANATSDRDVTIWITSASYPVTLEWNIKQSGATARLVIDGTEMVLRADARIQMEAAASQLCLRFEPAAVASVPKEFWLGQNYPNPFNPSTTILYGLPVRAHVQIKIFNLLGQEVATLTDVVEDPGNKSRRWDAAAFPSGMYVLCMEAASEADPAVAFTRTHKLLLMK